MVTRNEMKNRVTGINEELQKKNASFRIETKSVMKNNIEYYAFACKSESKCNPLFYYEDDWNTMDDEELASYLIMKYESNKLELNDSDIATMTSRENILNNVYPKLTSKESLNKIVEHHLVYEKMHDMIITFYVEIPAISHDDNIATFKLTTEMCASANINENKILDYAVRNIEKKAVIKPLHELLFNFTGDEEIPKNEQIIVVTNEKGLYGAALMLSSKVLGKVSRILDTNTYYILPSSIQEVICVRAEDQEAKDLLDMVKEINAACVPDNEKLSDNIYKYTNGIIAEISSEV